MGEPKVTEPTYEIITEANVSMPMRDGTKLNGYVFRPKAEGTFPVLVERVAYELPQRTQACADYYVPRGYVVVGQNNRGCYASEGVHWPGRDDAWGKNQDGYDTIEWAAEQLWSDGNVGTLDGSFSGFTQYLLAPTRPPHLKAMYIREGPADFYADWCYRYGAPYLFLRYWAFNQALRFLNHETAPPGQERVRHRLAKAVEELDQWNRHRPSSDLPPIKGQSDWYLEVMDHPEDGAFYGPINPSTKFHEVDTPMLHLGGWYDLFTDSVLRSYAGVRAHGKTAHCRENQRLVVGPWVHGPGNTSAHQVGEIDYGKEAMYDIYAERLRWYDHWLKGADNGAMDGPPVRVFLMGDNRWLDLQEWPPEDAVGRRAFLREGTGKSGESLNNGRLSFDSPKTAEGPDSYTYDPNEPIERAFKIGPRDLRPIEPGMLTYTSDRLTEDLVVVGPVRAELYALSSAPDTDWVVRLCDVWPDGRSIPVCDGILRARYRDSVERAELMTPGQIYRFEVDMSSTAQTFKAGHRIRIQVTSSDFPSYEPNLNTGGPFATEVQGQVAHNTVFHDAGRPSHVILPVMDIS